MAIDSIDPVHLDTDDLAFRDLLEDEYPHSFQSVILPIIVLQDGLVYLRGTAFGIGKNLALTAHHVLTQEDTDIQEVALLHVVPGPIRGPAHATSLAMNALFIANSTSSNAVGDSAPIRNLRWCNMLNAGDRRGNRGPFPAATSRTRPRTHLSASSSSSLFAEPIAARPAR